MRDIYSAAKITICYLSEDFAEAPGSLKELTGRTTDDRYAHRTELGSLITLNAYFSRLWIIQEGTVSKNSVLMFGVQLAPWAALYRLRDIAKSDVSTIVLDGYLYRRLTCSVDVLHRLTDMVDSKGSMTFFELLLQFSQPGFFYSGPRDQMFALLGLAPDARDFPALIIHNPFFQYCTSSREFSFPKATA